jgi:hypothetical protein
MEAGPEGMRCVCCNKGRGLEGEKQRAAARVQRRRGTAHGGGVGDTQDCNLSDALLPGTDASANTV